MVQVDNNTVIEFLKKKTVVKNWIEEVLKVKLGDDLIAALKNGIVLCYLMAEIEPLSIPKIQVCLLSSIATTFHLSYELFPSIIFAFFYSLRFDSVLSLYFLDLRVIVYSAHLIIGSNKNRIQIERKCIILFVRVPRDRDGKI